MLTGVAMSVFALPSLADVEEHKVACTATQTETITSAMAEAKKALVAASKSFASDQPVAKQTKWFGGLNSQSASAVLNVYDRSLAAATFTSFWCPLRNDLEFEWAPGDVAAVHPSVPGAMFITPDFFKLNTSGPDSQQGTIVHELTHIVGVGLRPEEYGITDAKALAAKDAAKARKNSDNYQYYVEDLIFGIP
jgi:peptidyl-Lys metalloendopeptidase